MGCIHHRETARPSSALPLIGSRVKPPRSRVNRRDLLRLRRLKADGASGIESAPALRAAIGPDPGAPAGDGVVLSRSALPAGTPGAVDLAAGALDLIDELEAQMTVYRDDSEVSRINATAHLGPVEVEPGCSGSSRTPSRSAGRRAGPTT